MSEVINSLEAKRRGFRPYPKYKDSGVEWLGEIPVHWDLKRLRSTVMCCQNGVWGNEPDGLNDMPCVRVADFDRVAFRVNMTDPTMRSIDERMVGTHIVRAGDLLLEKSGGGDKQPVGAVVMYDHNISAVCSNFIALMPVAEGFFPRFLTFFHAALYAARINTRSIKQNTGIQNLDSSNYLNEVVACPALREQIAIASFLDRDTAKTDALIEKNERLIDLLQEKRTALITQAVTKGLDPTVPMKDSGVEWLGRIPAHWEAKRLKQVVPQVTVGIVVTPSKYYVNEGVPCLRSLNIAKGHIESAELVFISRAANEFHRKSQIFDGDVVVVRTGRAGTATVVPLEFDGANCIDLLIVRKSEKIDSQFLYYFINSQITSAQVEVNSVGAIQEHYNTRTLAELYVPWIPLREQRTIVAFLDRETAKIDALVAKIQEAIDRLKEYRTALISAAVTGKIDLRGEVAQ